MGRRLDTHVETCTFMRMQVKHGKGSRDHLPGDLVAAAGDGVAGGRLVAHKLGPAPRVFASGQATHTHTHTQAIVGGGNRNQETQ